MKSLEENLTQYAAVHRDRRNIATHFVGIPLIVFAIVLALATASFPVGAVNLTAAAIASTAACLYYLRLDIGFGLAMAAVLFAMCAGASEITARLADPPVLGIAVLVFAVGWALQFWGHRFEGLKPAFLDDMKQLLIGPLFVVAEVSFFFGARASLRRFIEERVGPTLVRPGKP
ncbi:MAG: DUF962 domain-containing protein [Betaproteobacteria bacterium]|nr:DUF962 domain-containing protein [Betaproteobacteria bacterium]